MTTRDIIDSVMDNIVRDTMKDSGAALINNLWGGDGANLLGGDDSILKGGDQ